MVHLKNIISCPVLCCLRQSITNCSRRTQERIYIPCVGRYTDGQESSCQMARSTLYHSLVPDMALVDSTKQQSLLEHFSNQHIISDGLPIYRKLQQDDQDSVRLLTVEDLIVIAKRLSPVEVKEQLLRQIKQSIGDKSWRVRYMAAEHFNEVRQ